MDRLCWIILSICLLITSRVANQEQISIQRGVKEIDCRTGFPKEVFLKSSSSDSAPMFIIVCKNNGLSSQTITWVGNNKKQPIYVFPFQNKKQKKIGKTLRRGESFLIPINQQLLQTLENSNGLFLYDIMGKKKKIASKKDIQNSLQNVNKK